MATKRPVRPVGDRASAEWCQMVAEQATHEALHQVTRVSGTELDRDENR